jgi:hypothetical protein
MRAFWKRSSKCQLGGKEMKDYHVFRKQRVKNGWVIHKWYYYFVVNGKQVQKICKGCQTKNKAFAFVSKQPELSGGNAVLVKTVAEKMFFPESDHMKRRVQLAGPAHINYPEPEAKGDRKSNCSRYSFDHAICFRCPMI